MNVKVRKGWRAVLVLAPLTLIMALFFAFSGPFEAAAHNAYFVSNDTPADGTVANDCWGTDPATGQPRRNLVSPFGVYDPDTGQPISDPSAQNDPNMRAHDYWDDPNRCHAYPWGVNDNPFADALGLDPGDQPIDDVIGPDQAQKLLNGEPWIDSDGNSLQNDPKKVHIIDVRVGEEQFDGTAPCLVSILAAPYPMGNSGHPIWKVDTDGDGIKETWKESYHVPMFVGFYWAGTNILQDLAGWQLNIRPEPNPNFVQLGYQDTDPNSPNVVMNNYFDALKAQGEIADGDTFIFICQTGWRASYASAIFKNLPGFQNSKVYNLYGGMRAWTGTANPESVFSGDGVGPEDGGYVVDKEANGGNGLCAPLASVDAGDFVGNGIDDDNDGRIDENNPILGAPAACDQSKRLRTLPGNATNVDDAYNYLHATATDPNVTDRYAYNVTRIAKAGGLVMWNGTEQHVGVKPQWHTGFGAGDFNLGVAGTNVRWVDHANGKLAVDYVIQNNTASYNQIVEFPAGSGNMVRNIPRVNYYDECGGAPVEEGGQCESVTPAPWTPAYNVKVIAQRYMKDPFERDYGPVERVTTADNGVTVDSVTNPCLPDNPLGGYCAPILPGAAGVVTVTYNVPTGVTAFNTQPVVAATDIPDAARSFFGASFDWFFTYRYNHWNVPVTIPAAPATPLGVL